MNKQKQVREKPYYRLIMTRKFKGQKMTYGDYLDSLPQNQAKQQVKEQVSEQEQPRGIRGKLTARSLTERSREARKRLVPTTPRKALVTKSKEYVCNDADSMFPELHDQQSTQEVQGSWSNTREETIKIMKLPPAPPKEPELQQEEVKEDIFANISDVDSDNEDETENILDAMREEDEWDDI